MELKHPIVYQADSDPSMEGGFVPVYDREVPVEIRMLSREHGSAEALRVKVLSNDEKVCRIELTSEQDLFFHFECVIDSNSYRSLQTQQKLTVALGEYPNVLSKMLNACIREPENYTVILTLGSGSARLEFQQNLQYKYVDLMSLDFVQASADSVKMNANFRHQQIMERYKELQHKFAEFTSLVRLKNPSLLLQIKNLKSRPGSPLNRSTMSSRA